MYRPMNFGRRSGISTVTRLCSPESHVRIVFSLAHVFSRQTITGRRLPAVAVTVLGPGARNAVQFVRIASTMHNHTNSYNTMCVIITMKSTGIVCGIVMCWVRSISAVYFWLRPWDEMMWDHGLVEPTYNLHSLPGHGLMYSVLIECHSRSLWPGSLKVRVYIVNRHNDETEHIPKE